MWSGPCCRSPPVCRLAVHPRALLAGIVAGVSVSVSVSVSFSSVSLSCVRRDVTMHHMGAVFWSLDRLDHEVL